MDTQLLKQLQENHIAIWNERDRAKRDALMALTYAGDIRMYDPHVIFNNSTEISDFIDKLQTENPGFHFTPVKDMDHTQNAVRLFWEISMGNNKIDIIGNDFFLLENGKVKHLYVFMEPAK